jgi:hypothetical protein
MVCTFIDTLCKMHNLRYAEPVVELLDVTGLRLVAEAAGDFWSKSADGTAMAGRLVVEVG